MQTINIHTANLNGGSSILHIGDVREETVDFSRIEKELREIKELLEKGSPDYNAVETLEEASRERNWDTISKTASDFTSQLASGTLASLAASYFGRLLGL